MADLAGAVAIGLWIVVLAIVWLRRFDDLTGGGGVEEGSVGAKGEMSSE